METLFIGKNSIFLPETESTNSYATDLLKNVNLVEGTVIRTGFQKTGKGQRGNSWISEPLSNLVASVILRPTFLEIKNQFYLYQITALACYDTLSEFLDNSQFDIKIKWPNDIIVDRRKIAGILIENNVQGAAITWSVCGIGINVNQEIFPGLNEVTSLKLLTGKDNSPQKVLKSICRHLEKYYLLLKSGKYDIIRDHYSHRLFGINSRVNFEMNSAMRTLFVKGVSPAGLLHLSDENGKDLEVDVKQVKWHF
jgi:BirA family transcriptional regulator, biotin operon repressor / biotin---[acetyl-CoA-carboxylase] ligase